MLEVAFLGHLAQDGLDFRQLARLGNVVEGPQAHGLDGGLHAGMAGHHDRLGIRRGLFELLQYLHAGHSRHAQVEDGGIEGTLLQNLQRGPPVRAHRHFMAQARQLGAHEFLERFLIVHKQDAQAFMRRRGQGFPP